MTPAFERILTHLVTGAVVAYGVTAVGAALTLWLCFTPVLARYKARWDNGRLIRWRVVGGLVLLVLLGVALAARRNQVLAQELRAHGVVGAGRICKKKSKSGKGRRRWTIEYVYQVDTRTFAGSRVYPHKGRLPREARVGQRFAILYNAQKPSQSIMDLSTPVLEDSTHSSW